jgi:hypothetical protein
MPAKQCIQMRVYNLHSTVKCEYVTVGHGVGDLMRRRRGGEAVSQAKLGLALK